MRPNDYRWAQQLDARLSAFEKEYGLLPGIEDVAARETFIEQLVESIRRIEFINTVRSRPISPLRGDPLSSIYDPLRAALLFSSSGEFDEACWQVFLSVHFGKSLRSKWQYPRDIYSRIGSNDRWGWREVSSGVNEFQQWLSANTELLRGADGVVRRFSNHRKYTSLDAWSDNGTGAAVSSYVDWVVSAGGHEKLFVDALDSVSHDPKEAFSFLYKSMSAVRSFGRIARFDYLTMIGKLGLANIEPDIAYMRNATGPLTGAKLLFGELPSIASYELAVVSLGAALNVGMQVMEDAMCNWQKSPDSFISFRG